MIKASIIVWVGIKSALQSLGDMLVGIGPVGLFVITLLDSAFIPIPGGPDAAMIVLSARTPEWMPLYALVATVGSTIGCTMLYLAARRAGASALKRVKAERRERIENLLGRYDMLAVMVPSVLPPPFPFKPFILGAGVFKLRTARFITAVFIGRAARFLIEGWIAVRLGEEHAGPFIARHGLKVLIAVGVVLVLSIAFKLYRIRSRRAQPMTVDEIQSQRR